MKKYFIFVLLVACNCAWMRAMENDITPGNPYTHGYPLPSYKDSVRNALSNLRNSGKTISSYIALQEESDEAFNPRAYEQDEEILPTTQEEEIVVPSQKKMFSNKKIRQSKQQLAALLHTYYKYSDNQGALEQDGIVSPIKTRQYEFKKAVAAYIQILRTEKPDVQEADLTQWFMSLPIDKEGNTAAHVIAVNHDTDWLTVLHQVHARLNRKNKNGETPYDVAHNRMLTSSSVPQNALTATNTSEKKAGKKKRVRKSHAHDALAKKPVKGFRNVKCSLREKWNVERFNRFALALQELLSQEEKTN